MVQDDHQEQRHTQDVDKHGQLYVGDHSADDEGEGESLQVEVVLVACRAYILVVWRSWWFSRSYVCVNVIC